MAGSPLKLCIFVCILQIKFPIVSSLLLFERFRVFYAALQIFSSEPKYIQGTILGGKESHKFPHNLCSIFDMPSQ
jgi:hypothetical protein